MVCLFAALAVLSPRLALVCLWLFTPLVSSAFGGVWLWPLLGLIFAPFTALLYALVVGPLGSTNIWGWLVVLMGVLLDARSYLDAYSNRDRMATMQGFPRSV